MCHTFRKDDTSSRQRIYWGRSWCGRIIETLSENTEWCIWKEDLNIQILPERKDVTDTHAAIEYAISKGYDEIELYGVTGGRLDHFFAVMCLLEKYQDVSIKVIDQQNCIQLLKPGIHHIYNQEYYYFSLFALNESILSISQAEYTLDHYLLKRDDPLCVSNEVKGEYTIIENNENIILVQSRDAQ